MGMTYVNEKFDPHYTSKNDGGKEDFRRQYCCPFMRISLGLGNLYKLIGIIFHGLKYLDFLALT